MQHRWVRAWPMTKFSGPRGRHRPSRSISIYLGFVFPILFCNTSTIRTLLDNLKKGQPSYIIATEREALRKHNVACEPVCVVSDRLTELFHHRHSSHQHCTAAAASRRAAARCLPKEKGQGGTDRPYESRTGELCTGQSPPSLCGAREKEGGKYRYSGAGIAYTPRRIRRHCCLALPPFTAQRDCPAASPFAVAPRALP